MGRKTGRKQSRLSCTKEGLARLLKAHKPVSHQSPRSPGNGPVLELLLCSVHGAEQSMGWVTPVQTWQWVWAHSLPRRGGGLWGTLLWPPHSPYVFSTTLKLVCFPHLLPSRLQFLPCMYFPRKRMVWKLRICVLAPVAMPGYPTRERLAGCLPDGL